MSTSERQAPAQAVRVSTLELFFDLVFVFTITQLTSVLANHLTVLGVAETLLPLAIILWMYGGYAWLTNAVVPTSRFRRTLILIGMGSFLAIALALPTAFSTGGWLFGLGYFVVNAVHTGLFLAAGGRGAVRAMRVLAPINLLSATLVLAGGFAPGGWRWGLWIAALGVHIVAPYLNPIGEFDLAPGHFVERHGLVIIIALGESVVAIGAGAAGLPIDLWLVFVAVLGLTVAYLMWWVYFGGDDNRAEHALAAVPPASRGIIAVHAYGWAHLGLLYGIVALAAGLKKAVNHASGHLTLPQATVLAAGLGIYLFSDAVFRRILRIGRIRYRLVTAFVVLATIPLGLYAGALQLAAMIPLLVIMFYAEAYGENTLPRPASPPAPTPS